MDKVLVIIDMQNDFIDGILGSSAAHKACDNTINKIKNWNGTDIIYTLDTHFVDEYGETIEGKTIPEHCFYQTWGWQPHEFIATALGAFLFTKQTNNIHQVEKKTFGSIISLQQEIEKCLGTYSEELYEIHICGLCTDICVISNALILRAAFPATRIIVDASCCAGSTKERHKAALEVMKANCIEIIGEDYNGY